MATSMYARLMLFPEFARTLPDDPARLDQVLYAPAVLRQFEQHWGRANLNVGRPSIPMATYVRLMALKHRHRLGIRAAGPTGGRLVPPA